MVRNRNRGPSGVNPIGGEAYCSENGEQNCKETWKIHVFSRAFHLILNPHFFLATRLEKNDSRFMRRKPTVLKSNIKELKQRRNRRQRERQKRNRCRLAKTTTLHVHHALLTFLCRHCTTTTWKCGEREHKTTTFFFLSRNFRRKCQHLTNWTRWNKRDKIWKQRDFTFQVTLSQPSLSMLLN